MKRALGLSLVLAASLAAACGGGGSTPPPPPPVGGFSNADLKGQYAFSMTGQDLGGFFARAGSFTADGNGNITGGVEDINTALSAPATVTFTTSTSSVSADGRGTLTLTAAGGSSRIYSITMLSPTQGLIVETDGVATASGAFNLQNSAAFTLNGLNGAYVFDASGIDPSGNTDSIVGQFVSGGSGTITTGVLDENAGAVASGPVTIANATYQLDATFGPTNGRGQINNLAGLNYIFYIVGSTRIRMIETGSSALTVGDAVAQTNAPANNAAFAGSFAVLLGGSGTSGPITRLGRVTANGNGGLTQIALDTNDAGTVDRVPNGSLSAATYAIDANFPGSGRGTMTFTDSKLGTFQFLFYMSSPAQGVIQDNSKNNIADGTIRSQTGGPFANSSLAGNYAFNWSGVSSNSSTGLVGEEDFVGQLKFTDATSSNAAGLVDFSELSSKDVLFLNVGLAGALSIQDDGTTAMGPSNTLQLTTNNSPSSTLDFAAYVVNSNTMLVASTRSNRVTAGILSRQSK